MNKLPSNIVEVRVSYTNVLNNISRLNAILLINSGRQFRRLQIFRQ